MEPAIWTYIPRMERASGAEADARRSAHDPGDASRGAHPFFSIVFPSRMACERVETNGGVQPGASRRSTSSLNARHVAATPAAPLSRRVGLAVPLVAQAAAGEKGLALVDPTDFDAPAGKGVVGKVEGRAVAIGSARFLGEIGIDASALAAEADALRCDGATAVFVAVDGKPTGILGIADPIKATTPDAVRDLVAAGIRVVMLTGDNRTTADAVAAKLGIKDVEAEILPDHKADAVARLKREGRVVAMAGDGVNDAPALAAADVGVAMGTGTDVAIESAGVTLLRGDLPGLVRARRLSAATMRNIRQNLFFAFIYNGIGVPVAAGVLYPAFGLLLSPIIAAAAMSLSSVSVISNALRLRWARLG